jgi:hypothetical protein
MIALSALVSRVRQPRLARPYRMPLWPLTPLVALAGVAVTVLLQTGRDLAIVAAILAAGVLYDAVYLRPRRATHWILLNPIVAEPDTGDDRSAPAEREPLSSDGEPGRRRPTARSQ